jgi:hypothetical protein
MLWVHNRKGRTLSPGETLIGRCPRLTLCVLSLLFLLSCQRESSDRQPTETGQPAPPDLRGCTRVEIQYLPSLFESQFETRRAVSLLSATELAYVRSLDPIVVEEKGRITAIAEKISRGVYYDPVREGLPGVPPVAQVACYCGPKRVASFVIKHGPYIETEAHEWFDYHGKDLNLLRITTNVWPLVLRGNCALNLVAIARQWGSYLKGAFRRPAADTWCDATVARFLRLSNDPQYVAHIMSRFRCPAAGEGKCHYAMNPGCTTDSPADTVFLFETKAGWNQHGGPELFSFDNHDPKGGCVLLNDGTVKFIRTEEELKRLRWK